MNVLHTVAELDLRHGGPSRSVVALTDALARIEHCRVALLASERSADARVLDSVPAVERVDIVPAQGRLARSAALDYRRGVLDTASRLEAGIIHTHGIWRAENHWSAAAARSLGVLHVAQPRGMLSAWALAHKRVKKRVAWRLYQQRDLQQAAGLVATSDNELEEFRSAGLRAPVAVIPNGVALPEATSPDEAPAMGPRTMLFLSRLHKKKGLLELLEAWAKVRPEGWRLQVAGTDTEGLWATAEAVCRKTGIASDVEYLGEVDTATASTLYRQADVFVLPTHSENFGLVIAEALAHGVPVLTTRGAPWQELIRYDCGWWIELGQDALEHALRDATAQPRERLLEMGRNGRRLADRYTWSAAAEKTVEFYRWLLSGGPRPGFVDIVSAPAPKRSEIIE